MRPGYCLVRNIYPFLVTEHVTEHVTVVVAVGVAVGVAVSVAVVVADHGPYPCRPR